MKHISKEGLKKMINSGADFTFLHVLSRESYEKEHIPGSINIPWREIPIADQEGKISKDKPVIVYCESFTCDASAKAGRFLEILKYKVIEYDGGLDDWKDDSENSIHSNQSSTVKCDCD